MTKIQKPTRASVIIGIILLAIGVAAGFMLRGGKADELAKREQAMPGEAGEKKAELWTCSMHPQIHLPKPGKCPICGMTLIPLDTGSDDGGGLRELSVSESSAALMEIETAPVERRFVTANVRMVGKIDYDETRVSHITAWVAGRLDRLFVDYTGVPVKKGDHMVSIYSPELLSAQEELLQAIIATKALERSDVSIVREMTEATVVATREKLRLWGLTLEQITEIERRGKPDDHVTLYAPAGGIVIQKNVQEGMYVNTGTRIYTIADLSRMWVNLDAYESDLAWLRYGQHVEFTTVSYPGEVFTGTISFIHPVLDEATRTVKVRVNVSNEAGRLKPGMFVSAVAEAKVAMGGRIMDASLAGKWIGPMHPEILKDGPGMCDVCGMPLVRAESLGYVGAEPTAADKPLVIPATAPLRTGKRAIVYVEVPGKDKPTFSGREIVLGPRAGDYYLVSKGLEEGDRVVTKGNFLLDAELQIRAKPSMMTPEGGGGGGMAGMDHGGPAKKKGEDAMASPSMSLSAVVKSQLHDVIAAGMDAIKASSGDDLDQIHEAYRKLRQRVTAVNRETLADHAKMQWKEYSMLLGNDGKVGVTIQTTAEAARLADTTRGHLDAMQAKFGLMDGGHGMPEAPILNPEFKQQLGAVIERYLGMQAALAKDDAVAATESATKAIEALAKVEMGLVTGKDHTDWMKHAAVLKSLLNAIAGADGIGPTRVQFALLSEEIAALLTRFGVPEGRLYKAWCPMAFDGRGAWWIQNKEEIDNPYFGETMLRCGEIKEVLK
ncbi:MAG: efflux RND transporter periplasmic adaptor subunit [Halothiobacillus sp.]|jgi:Cu(I)/Ag(I) efflux system membrane fusion protein|nr:efflux RND transporter periplasmic adaptor subunit [Halothiobacillus sp.]